VSLCSENLGKNQQKNIELTDYFIEREKRCVESENFLLSGQIILRDLDGNSLLLKEKLNQSPILFFRFQGSNCQTCIDIEIKRIAGELRDVNPDKVVILVSDKDVNDLNYFKKINGIKFGIFLIEKEDLRIPMEQYNIPYLFILSPDGFVSSVFIPERNERKFSEQYYGVIKALLENLQC
jgi:peroxiredoxin